MDMSDGVPLESAEAALRLRRRSRLSRMGLVFWLALGWVGIVVGLAVLVDILPLSDPTQIRLLARNVSPGAVHWLGTDSMGRDMLSRLVFGARTSLTVGLGASLLGVAIGGALGLLAGYFRGRLGAVTVACADVLLAFPRLVLALAIVAYLGKSLTHLTLTLAVLTVPAATRVARSATLGYAQRDFVMAAHAVGASHLRILLRELLPNIAPTLGVFFLIAVAVIIVAEGALSFIGLGVPPPESSWGSMIADGSANLDLAPHTAFLPALLMFVTVLAFNLCGDRLRALADPRRGE
jgi:peptide/nickel transport system permease protein